MISCVLDINALTMNKNSNDKMILVIVDNANNMMEIKHNKNSKNNKMTHDNMTI